MRSPPSAPGHFVRHLHLARPFHHKQSMSASSEHRDLAIWGYAFGYFACYAPYSALTKALSQGRLPGMETGLSGFALLPSSTLASLVGMIVFLTAMGWWKHAGHREVLGISVPSPGPWTFLSGLCTAAIIGTTTLAYTFSGVSIVFMMLLMRGGVLVIAPIVDAATKRKVRWFSWVSLGLSAGALLAALLDGASYDITLIAAIDVAVYLGGYFVRLRFMSRIAKSDDPSAKLRYFVEEQMVATPAIVLTLAVCALVGRGQILSEVRWGFTDIWSSSVLWQALLVGVLSQGTGVFGGLILLDRRENTFCVPVNRASSVLAGLVATFAMAWIAGAPGLARSEIIGAVLVIGSMAVLAWPLISARRARGAAAAKAA